MYARGLLEPNDQNKGKRLLSYQQTALSLVIHIVLVAVLVAALDFW